MDARQFDAKVIEQIDAIRRIGRKRLRRSSDLDDFTQEVVIRLYASRGQLRDGDRLGHWAAASARNLAIEWNRKRAPILMSTAPEVPVVEGVDDPTLREERWQALVNALSGLDPVERDLLVSYYVDGIGYDELQRRHGLSYSAVGVRLHRAKQKLRKRLGRLVVAGAGLFFSPRQRAFGALPMTASRTSMAFIAGAATAIVGAVAVGWAMFGTAEAAPPDMASRVMSVDTKSLTADKGAPVVEPQRGSAGGVAGWVESIDGEAGIARAMLVINGPGGMQEISTDAEGAYDLQGLAAGTYTLDVRADGYRPRTGLSLMVIAGATSPVVIRLRAEGADGP